MLTSRKYTLALLGVLAAGISIAAPSASVADSEAAPIYADGPYAAAFGRFLKITGANALNNGLGVTVAGGYRKGPIALELEGNYTDTLSHSATLLGGDVDVLIFPLKQLPGLFGIVGAGGMNVDGYPGIGNTTFNVFTVNGGAGYILPLSIGHYQFGLRAQALYEFGKRGERSQDQNLPQTDLPVETTFHDYVANIGLQFPFGQLKVQAPEPQVRVVPVVAPADSDGDGVPDSVDQCPSTPPGVVVDQKGCPLPPPCKTPDSGEPLSLAGCKAGDVIVLQGVNFETSKFDLSADAKSILDKVAAELKRSPDIQIEIGGYTDSKGSKSRNLHLSEKRAEAVSAYLVGNGIDASRVTSTGYGESNPVADEATEEGRARNRRVELKVTKPLGEAPQGAGTPGGSGKSASGA